MLTEEQKEMYKQHTRVLEVRFALLYQIFEKEFGEIQARKIVEDLNYFTDEVGVYEQYFYITQYE